MRARHVPGSGEGTGCCQTTKSFLVPLFQVTARAHSQGIPSPRAGLEERGSRTATARAAGICTKQEGRGEGDTYSRSAQQGAGTELGATSPASVGVPSLQHPVGQTFPHPTP